MKNIFISLVTFNSSKYILGCLEAISRQAGLGKDFNLSVSLVDNASMDETTDLVKSWSSSTISVDLTTNPVNIGFCGAHNQNVTRFLKSEADWLLVLNPDVCLSESFFISFLEKCEDCVVKVGLVTPLLLKANENLEPIRPPVLDAAGMLLNWEARHLDRGSGQLLDEFPNLKQEPVFGGTGACLLLHRDCVLDLALEDRDRDRESLLKVFPELGKVDLSQRTQLFDEAFFAYREDADLSWRARNRGWICLFDPDLTACHVRQIVPENRAKVSKSINLHSVRNRFLLQVNNFSWKKDWRLLLGGLLFRNVLVILGVLIRERSSLRAFWEFFILLPRAMRRRRRVFEECRF